jgi:hypothetical protein
MKVKTQNSAILLKTSNTNYEEIKGFIAAAFYDAYKAKIKITFKNLMTVFNAKNEVIAAAGLRFAKEEELFFEQYLDGKIEDVLSDILGKKILREKIVEIGSLASKEKGAAKLLYAEIANFLKQKKYHYVVATGTDFLQKNFEKISFNPLIICDASPEKLKDKTVDWGSYYDSKPKVMALDVEQCCEAIFSTTK